MSHDFKSLTRFLVELGTDEIPHSNTPFLSHLIGVYRDLKTWGAPEHLVLAGLFHSIYGTSAFQGFTLPLDRREEVRALIGSDAERIAYINCALTRDSLDDTVESGGEPQLWDRFRNEPLPVSATEFEELVTLHLCDRLEQVGRVGNWDLRRSAWEAMARRLGGVALREWERVHAGAPAAPDATACWLSQPDEWSPLFARWADQHGAHARLHEWEQWGGRRVTGLTLGDDGKGRPVRILIAVPHAHEPAPTAALVNLASRLLNGCHIDGAPSPTLGPNLLERALITLLPDTNPQGRARAVRRVWDGELDNEAFLMQAFGESSDGCRFGRYPEWTRADHQPRMVGLIYEEIAAGHYVEPNTSRRSTHTRAVDELFDRYAFTHYLDMHQHEGDEAALLPASFDDLSPEQQGAESAWAAALLDMWDRNAIRHKGSYIPYLGLPRQEFFREYWRGRCPGMLQLTSETRNNRHVASGAPTPLARQLRSATLAIEATLKHLAAP